MADVQSEIRSIRREAGEAFVEGRYRDMLMAEADLSQYPEAPAEMTVHVGRLARISRDLLARERREAAEKEAARLLMEVGQHG